MAKPSLTNDVLSAVNSGKSKANEIASFILGNKNSVRSALARLEKRGEITRVSRGVYEGLTPPTSFSTGEDVEGWYLSGLQYGRNIGVKIYGLPIDEAEEVLTAYAERGIEGYNPFFYGIGEIPHNGEPLNEVIEVNL